MEFKKPSPNARAVGKEGGQEEGKKGGMHLRRGCFQRVVHLLNEHLQLQNQPRRMRISRRTRRVVGWLRLERLIDPRLSHSRGSR